MSKFYGIIGYINIEETSPGVWTPQKPIEKKYYGELIQTKSRIQSSNNVNDDITITNKVSIIADPYANQNFYSMHYAVIRGVKWKITDIEVSYPRLILTIGGRYNG